MSREAVEAMAREKGCTVEALFEWLGRLIAWEIDPEFDETLH
jgi:hypothetical protein